MKITATFTLEDDTYEKFKIICDNNHQSYSKMINSLIEEYVSAHETDIKKRRLN